MSQVNSKKTATKAIPPSGHKGYGFNSVGEFGIVNEDASFTVIPTSSASPGNIIANKGLGLLADLPTTFVTSDTYVTTDTFEVYVAVDSLSWSSADLIDSQLITDTALTTAIVYQYNDEEFIVVGNGGTVVPEIIEIIEADRTGGLFPIPHTLGVRYPTSIALYNGNNELVPSDNYKITCTAINVISLEIYELNISDTWHLSIVSNEVDSSVTSYDNGDLTNQELSITHNLGTWYPSSIILYKANGERIPDDNYGYSSTGINTGTLTDYEENIPDIRQLILTK